MSDIPADLDAEECLLGAMILSNQAIDDVADSLSAGDFYKPAHAYIFDAAVRLRQSGSAVDVMTVSNLLKEQGVLEEVGGSPALLSLQINTPSTTAARHYAEIVLDRALRRRLLGEGLELAERVRDLTSDVHDVLESHRTLMASLGTTFINREPDDIAVEDFLRQPRQDMSPWVSYGLIRRRHKLILIAKEGGSKSWLLRFIALCGAYGIQPFRHRHDKPIRTLIVDLENPEDALYDSFELILKQVSKVSPQSETVNRLWWRPAGINLRSRVDVAEFENVIRVRRPDLVCFGPLYAAYDNTSKDFGWETAAREVQTTLKQLMVRYNFALMIEDHAPQGDAAGKRQMRPYGSSFWRRWPDIGLGLETVGDRDDIMKVTRWRGDRVVTDWPSVIERGTASGSPWPFVGRWEESGF